MKNKIIPMNMVEMEDHMGHMTHLRYLCNEVTRNGYFWYIEGPDQNICVDVGSKASPFGEFSIKAWQVQEPEGALQDLGLKPEDIDLVILTHVHGDHLQFAEKFSNAEFIIQEDELKAAKDPHPLVSLNYKLSQPLLEKLNFRTIEGDQEIVDGVSVMKTPGHAEGGQSVVVDTDEGDAIITGLCTIDENFYPPEEVQEFMPVIPPAIHIDLREAFDSMLKIKEKADIIIPNHEHKFAEMDQIPEK